MMDIITRTISGDGKSTEVGKLLADGYTILTSATSQYDGRIYITLVMGKAPALEAAREPAPAPIAEGEASIIVNLSFSSAMRVLPGPELARTLRESIGVSPLNGEHGGFKSVHLVIYPADTTAESAPAPTNTEQIDRAYALIGKAKRSAYLIGQTGIERQLEEASRLLAEGEPAPAPETDTVTISRAQWNAAQERVKNAINALHHVRRETDVKALWSSIAEICDEALSRDTEFEVALGM